jgi:hypothetical protein
METLSLPYLNKGAIATLSLAIGLIAFSPSHAQETVSSTSTVVVQNAFTLTEVRGLDFGTIVALRDGTGGGSRAFITVDPDSDSTSTLFNSGGVNDDRLIEIIGGNRAEYSISGAIPNATLDITLPNGPFLVTCAACSGSQADFSIDDFIDDNDDEEVTTDGSGNASFFLGAELSTISGTAPYEDGVYTATYDLTVSY